MKWDELEALCAQVRKLIPRIRNDFKNPKAYSVYSQLEKSGRTAELLTPKLPGFFITYHHGWDLPSAPSLPYFHLRISIRDERLKRMLRERLEEIQDIKKKLFKSKEEIAEKVQTSIGLLTSKSNIRKKIEKEVAKSLSTRWKNVLPPSDSVILTFRFLPLDEEKESLAFERKILNHESERYPLAYKDIRNLVIVDDTISRENILLQMGIYCCRDGLLGKQTVDSLIPFILTWIENNWKARKKWYGSDYIRMELQHRYERRKTQAASEDERKQIEEEYKKRLRRLCLSSQVEFVSQTTSGDDRGTKYVTTATGEKISAQEVPDEEKKIPLYMSMRGTIMIHRIIENFNIPRTARTLNSYILTLLDVVQQENTLVAELAKTLGVAMRTIYRWMADYNYPKDKREIYSVNDETHWSKFCSYASERVRKTRSEIDWDNDPENQHFIRWLSEKRNIDLRSAKRRVQRFLKEGWSLEQIKEKEGYRKEFPKEGKKKSLREYLLDHYCVSRQDLEWYFRIWEKEDLTPEKMAEEARFAFSPKDAKPPD